MKRLKLYIETSAWNFYYADDTPELRDITIDFFNLVEQKKYDIHISKVVIDEIGKATKGKEEQLSNLIKRCDPLELEIYDEAKELAKIYLERKIVPFKKIEDAMHVAIASVWEMDALVTWNYKHMANIRRSELFHGVNLENGYTKKLELITPMEVMDYEI